MLTQPVSHKMSFLVFQEFLSPCRPEVNELAHMEEKEKRIEHSTRNCMLKLWRNVQNGHLVKLFNFRPFESYLTNVNYLKILFNFSQIKSLFVCLVKNKITPFHSS